MEISIASEGVSRPPRPGNPEIGWRSLCRAAHAAAIESNREFSRGKRPITARCSRSRPRRSGKSFVISTTTRSGSAALARAGSRTASQAIPWVRSEACFIAAGTSGGGCWPCPTPNARGPMNSAASPHCRSRIFRPPCALPRWWTGDRSFVEWWADFDCEPVRRDELTGTLRGWFAQWLESLRGELDGRRVPHETASVNE